MNFHGKVLHLVVGKTPTRKHYVELVNICNQYGMKPGTIFNLETFSVKELASNKWPFSRFYTPIVDQYTPVANHVVLLAWGLIKENHRLGELGMEAARDSKYPCVSLGITKLAKQPINLIKASSDSVLTPFVAKDQWILGGVELKESD